MLEASTLKFLKELKKNNNREWFADNKHKYDHAKADVVKFVSEILNNISKSIPELQILKPEKCIMRIYRDVRFSKNKEPYKLNFGIYFPIKDKSVHAPGYYLHIQPGESFVGGGFWMPAADALKNIRQEIDYNTDEFLSIISSKPFKKYFDGLSEEDKLQTAPKGYAKDHPHIELLKLKSFTVFHAIGDEEFGDKKITKAISEAIVTMKPFVDFLDRANEQ